MVLGNHALMTTLYDVLSVEEDACFDEIKSSYRNKVLNHHPDKLRETSGIGSPEETGFLEIQQAWETLSDSRSRRLYDIELAALRQEVLVADDVDLYDMMIESDGENLQLYYSCQCGDYFSIDSQELEEIGCPLQRDENSVVFKASGALPASVIIACGSCSLRIRISVE